jgi:hypothetical protein
MKRLLNHLFDQIMSSFGLGPSDEELELDRICDEENQKVYKQFEIDIEAISKKYKVEELI